MTTPHAEGDELRQPGAFGAQNLLGPFYLTNDQHSILMACIIWSLQHSSTPDDEFDLLAVFVDERIVESLKVQFNIAKAARSSQGNGGHK